MINYSITKAFVLIFIALLLVEAGDGIQAGLILKITKIYMHSHWKNKCE